MEKGCYGSGPAAARAVNPKGGLYHAREQQFGKRGGE